MVQPEEGQVRVWRDGNWGYEWPPGTVRDNKLHIPDGAVYMDDGYCRGCPGSLATPMTSWAEAIAHSKETGHKVDVYLTGVATYGGDQ